MQKIININLGGLVFRIEENAYEVLSQYITSIREYFQHKESGLEISGDIESRLAEMLYQKCKTNDDIVNKLMVDEVISRMGLPNEFAAEDFHTNQPNKTKPIDTPPLKRKLFRDPDQRMIGGVCAGIGTYFGIERWLIRVLLLAMVCIPYLNAYSAYIIPIYIILWIAIPKAKTMADRMEMQGEPVNISTIEQKFKQTFKTPHISPQKAFVRSTTDRMIGGVCGGIGDYFNQSPWKVRALFLIALLFFGTGVIVYLILWIAVPFDDPYNPVSKQSPNHTAPVQTGVPAPTANTQWPRFINLLLGLVESVMMGLLKFIGKVGGFIFIVIIAITSIALLITYATVSNYQDLVLANSLDFKILTAAIAGTVGIPMLFILIVAIALMGAQIKINKILRLTLLFGWFLSLGLLAYTLVNLVPEFNIKSSKTERIPIITSGKSIQLMVNSNIKDQGTHTISWSNGFEDQSLGFQISDSGLYSRQIELIIERSSENSPTLVYEVSAQGKNQEFAERNKKSILYNFNQLNNNLLLDSYFRIPRGYQWRNQQISLKLMLPIGYQIKFHPEYAQQMDIRFSEELVNQMDEDTKYSYKNFAGKIFEITEKGVNEVENQ